jgi:SAM-dependent methyltransferase
VNRTRSSYDAVAEEYVRHISDELDYRPRERDLLARFARQCGGLGFICDLGCGPGHIADYVCRFNPEVIGLDLSFGLLRQARDRNTEIVFLQGDMLALPFAGRSLGGIVAFYSIIHFEGRQVDQALEEMHRVLIPGGQLLLGFHVGMDIIHVDELWGVPVNLDAKFFLVEDLTGKLTKLGFRVVEEWRRDPYPEVEYQSVRGYIWAEKPATRVDI